jgi:putative transposase
MGSKNGLVSYLSNRNVDYSCKYHVVWCPKYRKKVLIEPIAARLKTILCEVDPQYGTHRLVRQMKGRSSRLLRQEFGSLRSHLPTLWTNSDFVCSCGGAPLAVIKQYIEDQQNV